MQIEKYPALSWETAELQYLASPQERKEYNNYLNTKLVKLNNISKILGYLPGLGIIVGIARMFFSIYNDHHTCDKQMARGMAEMYGFGPFLLIADVIVYAHNKGRVKEIKRQEAAKALQLPIKTV